LAHNIFEGGALARQLSSSHIQPRSLSGYQDFFRQNSNPETGWLEVNIGGGRDRDKEDKWEKAWVAFENRSLSFSQQAGGNFYLKVPMDQVLSFRTDVRFLFAVFDVSRYNHIFYMRVYFLVIPHALSGI
jgi:hypothetical protein